MTPSRLFYAAMMIFWVCFLSLLALVVTYAPQGGVHLAGLKLFANTGLIDSLLLAMKAIGFHQTTQSVVFGLLGGLNLAAAGLVLFAAMFRVLGEEAEQRDARPLAEGAAMCAAAAAAVTVIVGFAGGQAGALLLLETAALGGLLLIVLSLTSVPVVSAPECDETAVLDDVIADHAASHAAFSAQLAQLSRREQMT
ncbi:hypothetical protein OEG84_02070 [Hoeflea sp. G2-23]|uniref:Uncharacterized protein n=1 Tax=Hoeflea algicola TaxID=2983763 RepID=A0ABT3Z438_9HYPH|nr:hypothetical protein [Hoeflea algicola]MCY0146535.1 hypothetical protein [Hoeflea algicola]